jgi:hypothetical protein
MPTRKSPKRAASRKSPAKRRAVRNPVARGVGPIDRALKKIEREVGEYAGSDAAQKAMEALILAIPLKGNVGEWKKQIKDAIIADRGESDRKYVTEAMRSGKPGVFVRATNLVDYWQFEGDLILIHGGKFGGTESTGEVVVLTKDQLVLTKAVAVDGNMEHYPVEKAAKAIIDAYGFGNTTRDPWFEAPSARSRRY